MFEWQELDLTSEILFMPREHKIHIFEHVMFFLSYRHADDAVFDDLPKIFDLFPKNFQNCSEGQTNVSEHFPNIFRRLPKIAKDDRRSEDVSIIHQQFKHS